MCWRWQLCQIFLCLLTRSETWPRVTSGRGQAGQPEAETELRPPSVLYSGRCQRKLWLNFTFSPSHSFCLIGQTKSFTNRKSLYEKWCCRLYCIDIEFKYLLLRTVPLPSAMHLCGQWRAWAWSHQSFCSEISVSPGSPGQPSAVSRQTECSSSPAGPGSRGVTVQGLDHGTASGIPQQDTLSTPSQPK